MAAGLSPGDDKECGPGTLCDPRPTESVPTNECQMYGCWYTGEVNTGHVGAGTWSSTGNITPAWEPFCQEQYNLYGGNCVNGGHANFVPRLSCDYGDTGAVVQQPFRVASP